MFLSNYISSQYVLCVLLQISHTHSICTEHTLRTEYVLCRSMQTPVGAAGEQ